MGWKDVIEGKPGDKVLLNGNEATARGAIEAGVCFASSYPGSPTTEIIETLDRVHSSEIYTEWSVNEIVALEGAAAASFAGLRAMCVMKSDGLNVAFDFLTSMNLGGCKGGLVVAVADDPQGHSSVKEYDARYLAKAAMVPVLEYRGGRSKGNDHKGFCPLERINDGNSSLGYKNITLTRFGSAG
jgi:indolepyruvate ferredoxin oxidoreductase alpha subunit